MEIGRRFKAQKNEKSSWYEKKSGKKKQKQKKKKTKKRYSKEEIDWYKNENNIKTVVDKAHKLINN